MIRELTLSPTSIAMLKRCPRSFWYKYVEKLPIPITEALAKGNVVHDVLEKFANTQFKLNEYNVEKVFERFVDQQIDISSQRYLKYFKDEKEAKNDIKNIVYMFITRFIQEMKGLVESKIATNYNHAFNLIKPKWTEQTLKDKNLNVMGKIDYIQTSPFSNKTTIIDYKTSKKYGYEFNNDYKDQVAIYAYLASLNNIAADTVAINYLRYGEIYFFEITPELIAHARNEIRRARDFINLNHDKKENFYRKQSSFCKFCPFYKHCLKELEEEKMEVDDNVNKRDGENKEKDRSN